MKPSPTQQVDVWLEENESKLRQYAQSLASRHHNAIHDADDLFQIMSMKVYMQARMSPEFMKQSNSYLLKTAWNEALYALRKQRRYEMTVTSILPAAEMLEDEPIELIASDDPGPETLAELTQDNGLILRAVASLPEKSQEVCSYLYAGYRPAEIARIMKLSSRASITYHMKNIQKAFLSVGLQPIA